MFSVGATGSRRGGGSDRRGSERSSLVSELSENSGTPVAEKRGSIGSGKGARPSCGTPCERLKTPGRISGVSGRNSLVSTEL